MTFTGLLRIAVICCSLTLLTLPAVKGTTPCTNGDYMRANADAASLKSWPQVYRAYKQFAQCDQGGLGELYSDAIAKLLSERWNEVDQLNRLTSHSKTFERFVLRHIDELMTPDQANTIRNNAEAHCPSDAKRLCRNIAVRISETSILRGPGQQDVSGNTKSRRS